MIRLLTTFRTLPVELLQVGVVGVQLVEVLGKELDPLLRGDPDRLRKDGVDLLQTKRLV